MTQPTPNTPTMITVLRDDLYAMLTAALRHSLGRSTYVVEETCELFRRYYRHLELDQRVQLMNFLARALSDANKIGPLYRAMDCDLASWRNLSEFLFEHNVAALPRPDRSQVACTHPQVTDTMPARCHACGEIVR